MLPVSAVTSSMPPSAALDTTAATPNVQHGGQAEALASQDLAAFHQAIGPSVPEVQAQAVQDAGGLGSQFSSGVQDVSLRLAGWQAAHASAASTPVPLPAFEGKAPSLTKTMQDAIAGMQGAYVFAIEATLASHGSTELTKTFNTLLKGQ